MLAGLALQQYAQVRAHAVQALRVALNRFPELTPAVLPVFLAAIAGLPLPEEGPLGIPSDAPDPGGVSPAFLKQLLTAAEKACTGAAAPQPSQSSAGNEKKMVYYPQGPALEKEVHMGSTKTQHAAAAHKNVVQYIAVQL